MTATLDEPTRVETAAVAVEDHGPRKTRLRPRNVAAWVVLGIVMLLVAVLVVEDPIAHVWYTARQNQLGAEGGEVGRIPVGRQVGVLVISYPAPPGGSTAGRTQKLFVVQGDGTSQLRGAPGHQPETALPGDRGNVVIFGHRHDWGAPFSDLATLTPGSEIEAQSVNATLGVVYTVKAVKTVVAGDDALLAPTRDYRLTLVTDAGGRFSNRWLVVTAVSGVVDAGPSGPVPITGPDPESAIANGAFGALLLALAAGAVVVVGLRRRSSRATVWILISPIALAALVALVFEFDLVFSFLA